MRTWNCSAWTVPARGNASSTHVLAGGTAGITRSFPWMSIKHALLFVCAGNTCRSPAAARILAGVLEREGEDPAVWLIDSAGLRAGRGQPASAGMAEALSRRGLDLDGHRSRPVEDLALTLYPLVLVMEEDQKQNILARFPVLKGKVHLLAEMSASREAVEDPFGNDRQAYEKTARQIERMIEQGFLRIVEWSRVEN